MKIKNREELSSKGDIQARKVVLEACDEALQSLDSYHVIKQALMLDGKILRIGNWEWDLDSKSRVYVIGAGKACNSMCRAIEEILGDYIKGGIVIVKQLDSDYKPQRIELVVGGHPLPNQTGLLASKRILNLVDQSNPDDLFISLISGGSSALMNCPVPGITLDDEILLTKELLNSGARILEVNAVRRHISLTNGGRLAQRVERKDGEMINLILADIVTESLKSDLTNRAEFFFGTPVGPDNTTIDDAIKTIEKYNLWSRIPESVSRYLRGDRAALETPKTLGSRIHHFVLQTPFDACEAAKRAVDKTELPGIILTTFLEGEGREAGTFLASVVKEIGFNHRPIRPPCILIAGGETTTKVADSSGLGGPNQEIVLSFATEIRDKLSCCIAAIGTDGTDGPTEVAGGIADSKTLERAEENGLDICQGLKGHNSYEVLKVLGDGIITGNTGTNLCDLILIYVA